MENMGVCYLMEVSRGGNGKVVFNISWFHLLSEVHSCNFYGKNTLLSIWKQHTVFLNVLKFCQLSVERRDCLGNRNWSLSSFAIFTSMIWYIQWCLNGVDMPCGDCGWPWWENHNKVSEFWSKYKPFLESMSPSETQFLVWTSDHWTLRDIKNWETHCKLRFVD